MYSVNPIFFSSLQTFFSKLKFKDFFSKVEQFFLLSCEGLELCCDIYLAFLMNMKKGFLLSKRGHAIQRQQENKCDSLDNGISFTSSCEEEQKSVNHGFRAGRSIL